MEIDQIDNEQECVEIDGDSVITLTELEKLIPQLKNKYGDNAAVRFDAGYNNVICLIGVLK